MPQPMPYHFSTLPENATYLASYTDKDFKGDWYLVIDVVEVKTKCGGTAECIA